MKFLYLFFFLILILSLLPISVAFVFLYFTGIGLSLLEFSLSTVLLIIFLITIGSFFNIPLTKQEMIEVTEKRFFGLVRKVVWRPRGISVNIGGAMIPLLITGYFLPQVSLNALFITTSVVAFFSFLGARFVKERGVLVPMILPILFSSFFSLLLAPQEAMQVAFSAGVLGVLIGADLLYLPWIMRKNSGVMSIGGAGIFDGIFLVGLFSAILCMQYNMISSLDNSF
jgi:uncharacterized membrane protein